MKLWDLSEYSEKSNIQEAYLPKTSISGQIVSAILAQLCSNDSIQILLKINSLFFLVTSGFKNSVGMGKESITLSMELAKTQSHEFECFEDNYSLTISTQGSRINTRKFNTKGT